VELESGESRQVSLCCPGSKLEWYNPRTSGFELEHIDYEVFIGTSGAGKDLLSGLVKL
jgi:beta-glucosidase